MSDTKEMQEKIRELLERLDNVDKKNIVYEIEDFIKENEESEEFSAYFDTDINQKSYERYTNVDKYIDYGYQYILAKLNTTKYSLKILKETDNKDMSSETIEICNRRILYFSLKEHEKINIILNYEGEEIACNPLAESVQEICINGSGQLKFKNDIDKPFLKIGLKDCNIQSVDFKDIKMVMFENKIIYEPKDQDELLAYFEKNKKEFKEKYKDHIIEY